MCAGPLQGLRTNVITTPGSKWLSMQHGAVHKAAPTDVSLWHTARLVCLPSYSRWIMAHPSPHHYCLTFILPFTVYKAGVGKL